jgi:hypothetical protein
LEVITMPKDLAGNIAPRFHRALEGLLVMGGMLVDPGYQGRLHFQLANIGDGPFRIEPGTTSVAAIQFLPVVSPTPDARKTDSGELLERLFYSGAKEPLRQLEFFSEVESLKEDQRKLWRRLEDQELALGATKLSTEQLLVFGVFLVSITLFTVAIGVIVDAFANGSLTKIADKTEGIEVTAVGLAVGGGLLLVVAVAVCVMMVPVWKIANARRGDAK